MDWRWKGGREIIAETRVVEVSFAGVSSGLWLKMSVGLGLWFRLGNGFGFGLELGVADGMDWQ